MKAFILFLLPVALLAASAPTARVDNSRAALNDTETLLTPSNVTTGKFGLLGTYSITHSGDVYSQVVYVQRASVSLVFRDLAIVGSMDGYIYAFDARATGSNIAPIWTLFCGTPRATYPKQQPGNVLYYDRPVGSMSTPVADSTSTYVYAVCADDSGSPTAWKLWKIALSDGSGTSVTLSASVPGTGAGGSDTTSGANLLFYPAYELQRSPLTLANGNVYIQFASYDDVEPWHGWVLARDAVTLASVAAWCATPNGNGGGLWYPGGMSVDSAGNLYIMTGNGDYNGTTNFGTSAVKLSPTLAVLDWWTPSNYASMNSADQDLSSGGPILIPGTTLMVGGGKDYRLYSIDTACMGHLQGSGLCSGQQQIWNINPSGASFGIYTSMFMGGKLYTSAINDKIYSYALSGSTFSETPVTSTSTFKFPGAIMSGSSNAGTNGILWMTAPTSTSSHLVKTLGTLRALDPADPSVEYWSAEFGYLSKFAAPTIANGRVYVPTQGGYIAVYGPLPSSARHGQHSTGGAVAIH